MNNIFKHFNKIDISEIADSEASKVTTAVFKIHKTFCFTCRNVFNEYKILSEKVISTFNLEEKKITTRSDKVYQLYSYTLKAAVYALVVGITFSTVGIAFAQTQTEVDIIPDVTFFEDGNLITFSEEEVENLFSEVLDPIQATLITFVNSEIITADEVVEVVEEQIDVLTTLVVTEEETTEVVEEETTTEVVTAELSGLDNALSQIEANIATALQNNNLNALNGLENAKERVLKNIEKAQEKLEEGKEKADKEISKAQEKAQNEIKKAQEKAEEIISEVKDDASEKDVVKAQLKAERTLEKAQEKAEKELEKAQEKAEKELEKAEKEAEKELEKAEKEAEKAEKEVEKSKDK